MPPRAGNPMAFLPPASRQGGNRGRGFRQHRHPPSTPSPCLYPLLPPVIPPSLAYAIPHIFPHVIPSVAEESQPHSLNSFKPLEPQQGRIGSYDI